MASLLDLRRRIRSVKNTRQITKAMKMVAASKLRRAQERVVAARPYATTLRATLASVAARVPAKDDGSAPHPLLEQRPEKKVWLVSVTGDKGLCGAFNSSVNRATAAFLRGARERGFESVKLVTLGRKGNDYWKSRKVEIASARPGIFSSLSYATARDVATGLAEAFRAGEVDAVYVVYNEFRSAISQVVKTQRLLPVEVGAAPANAKAATAAAASSDPSPDFLFEPNPEAILTRLVPRAFEFAIYQALLESNAAEHAARMTAMDGASKNAGEMIDSLTLTYNRARQARITKELIEIVSGAAALD